MNEREGATNKIDWKSRWAEIIAARPDYSHPVYEISDWKRDVLAGKTRAGYAEAVATLLVGTREPIPVALSQFSPKSHFGKTLQRAVVKEFEDNGYCSVKQANGYGWFAMRHAFETLTLFIVAQTDEAFLIAKATAENKADLREMSAVVLYEWDGVAVPFTM
jgi:hypothetical protein